MIKFDSFSLLQRGYFPKELPYNFNTFSFALMTKEMIAKLKEGSFRGVKGESLPITFTIPRGISSRRNIAIPNPWNYLKIVSYLEDKEKDINDYFSHTEYSLSFPVNSVALAKRCLVPCSPSYHYFRQEMIKRSIGKNVILKLDINNFYPSVYTHAIEWAFTGKDYAKEIWASKGKLKHEGYEIGEKIDELIRKSQSDETHGIPIGPDVSFLVGEFILCKIDEEIHATYYTSASYLKERLFTIPGSDEFEKAAIEQADQLWSKVKLEFYEKSGLSGHLDEKDYEAKFSEDMPDDEVLTDLFTRIMLINAHLSDESLEDVEAEMVRRLSSFFQY